MVGEVARSLYRDAEAMLERIVAERWISANAVVGLWPANSVVDDIVVYADEQRARPLATLHTLRQQMARDAAHPNHALADFVAPTSSGVADYVGAFAVTTGHREEVRSEQFARENDDYNAILFKALCDRLAEAFAERMHEWVRREGWGYAPEESLSREALIAESYRGIRPAPGYGCQPDHTEKGTLFALLDAPARAGIHLTDSFAMQPGSSVSGSTSPTPRRATSASGGSATTSSRTTPRARAGPSRKHDAGSRRSSTATPASSRSPPERGGRGERAPLRRSDRMEASARRREGLSSHGCPIMRFSLAANHRLNRRTDTRGVALHPDPAKPDPARRSIGRVDRHARACSPAAPPVTSSSRRPRASSCSCCSPCWASRSFESGRC